jgi:hypothetical protein
MKATRQSWLVALAVTAYCAWQARDLLATWPPAPFDRAWWLAFLIWLLPLVWARGRARAPGGEPAPALLGAGLGFAFLGAIVSLNALCCAGLACAVVGLVPWSPRNLPWLAASAAWMPALGYALSSLDAAPVVWIRLGLALGGVVWMALSPGQRTEARP